MRKRNRGRMRTGLLAAVGACAMVVATLATARVASASTSSQPVAGQRLVVISSPMKIVGFEQAVAAAHGFTVRTDRAGRQFEVSSAGQAVPNGSVSGNCGSSYVYILAKNVTAGLQHQHGLPRRWVGHPILLDG
jgi:hypothetical protein